MYDDFDDYDIEDYDFNAYELSEHKRSDKVKWIISFLLIFVLLAGMIGAWALLLEERFATKEEAPQQEEEVIEEETGTAEVRSVALAMKAAAAVNGGVSKELTATVYPSDARNKAVDWTLEWLDAEKQDVLSEYLTLVPSSDGANTATLTCLQAFEGEALITVTTREGGYIDTCRVVFVGDPTSLTVSCDATTASGSFGSYYELGVGNSYTFDLTPDNAFGFVGAECSYSYTVTGYGSFKVQQQKYSTSYGTRTWVDGTEKTVNIKDVTTVSKYEPSVFDWAIDGNKLTVTVNCTLDSYYTDSVRVENTITYDDKFREYTDDNWYYEVKVTETNSGVSHTFKVRPVKVVTNVVLDDEVITF